MVSDISAFCDGIMVVEIGKEVLSAVSVELDHPAFSRAGACSTEEVGEFRFIRRFLIDGTVVGYKFS